MSKTAFDVQYSPSCWCKRDIREEDVIPSHIDFASKASNYVVSRIPCQRDVIYGDSERQRLDIYGTDLPAGSPIYIHVHGGYWQQLHKDQSNYMVPPLYGGGYRVIVLGYDLCPNVRVENIVTQIERAVAHCLQYALQTQASSVKIGGHSAGGQLVANLFRQFIPSLPDNERNLIKAAYLISGVFDLVPLVNTYLNKALGLTCEMACQLSPLRHDLGSIKCGDINSGPECDFHVIVASNDPPTFITQSRNYYDKLKNNGFKVELSIILNTDHFTIVEGMSSNESDIIKLILDL